MTRAPCAVLCGRRQVRLGPWAPWASRRRTVSEAACVSSSLGSGGEVSRWGTQEVTPLASWHCWAGQECEAPWSCGAPVLEGAREGRCGLDFLSGPTRTWTLLVCEKARALSCPPSCSSALASRPMTRPATPGTGSTSCP